MQTYISNTQTNTSSLQLYNQHQEIVNWGIVIFISESKSLENLSLIYFSKLCSRFSMLCVVKIGRKPEDVALLKRSKKDIKNVDEIMINHDMQL